MKNEIIKIAKDLEQGEIDFEYSTKSFFVVYWVCLETFLKFLTYNLVIII